MKATQSGKSASAPVVAVSLVLAFLFAVGVHQLQPPAAVPSDAPLDEFSAARALIDLERIARAPHPTGSAENRRVREYIFSRMSELALEPQIQTATALRSGRTPVGATVSNIVGRIKGTGNTGALLLAAHYDSVPSGAGASDDGSAVVTLLETARALGSGKGLRNDVIFLMTDGEELGLLGARAFVEEHPWAKDAGVVLNFEARGTCGPSLMFETGPRNGWMISRFADAVSHAVTSSFIYEFYRRMPNDTDFTVFRNAGISGLNFSFIGCWPRYHTAKDNFENIDPRSLQHDGDQALALTRHLGGLDLSRTVAGDAVYFSLLGATVHYPAAWAIPAALVAATLFILVCAAGLSKGRLTWRGTALGASAWVASAAASLLIAEFGWRALSGTSLVASLPYGNAYNGELFASGFAVVSVTVLSAVYAALHTKTSHENLIAGALVWWTGAAVLSAFYFNGGSYLFAWPLLLSLAALFSTFAMRTSLSGFAAVAIWTLPAAAGALVFFPIPYLLVPGMSTGGLPILVISTSLLAGLLAPQLLIMTDRSGWWFSAAAGAAAVALFVSAAAAGGFSEENPDVDTAFYMLDRDSGRALWISTDRRPDGWTSQFLGTNPEKGNLNEGLLPFDVPVLKAPAEAAHVQAATVDLVADATAGGLRNLKLRINSPAGTRSLWIEVREAEILEAFVNGKKTESRGRPEGWGLYYVGPGREGILLDLSVRADKAPRMRIVTQSAGLPELPGRKYLPRPPELMPSPWPPFDSSTLVSESVQLTGESR